jgi:Putative peptidoglycan binding domain
MTWPLAAKVGLGVAGVGTGVGLYRWRKARFQSMRHLDKDGHPIQVVVPVNGQPAPQSSVSNVPIPPNNGTKAVFRPPPPVGRAKLSLSEASIVTPTGAANLSVDSVTDAQHALNALGASVPVDGMHNGPTQAALAHFQSTNGLPTTAQADQATKTALQSALVKTAGVNAHIGQSLPVQAAASALKAGTSSPLGQSILSSGLGALTNLGANVSSEASGALGGITSALGGLFSADPATDPTAPLPNAPPPANKGKEAAPTKPTKDAICKLQKVLNDLGASPPLTLSGDYDKETVAALKAFQISYGLVADGVPSEKTIAAVVVAKDPTAHEVVVPTLPKAADHVAAIATTTPPSPDAATDAKAPLVAAASNLAASAATNPDPHPAEVHASTAAGMAATASTVAPPTVAAPLAKASEALAAATNAATTPPTALTNAAGHLADAAIAAAVTPGGQATSQSLQAAADHVSAAAAAPNADTQADHLNAAATHLANAASGAAAPAIASTAPGTTAAAPGAPPATGSGAAPGATDVKAAGEFDHAGGADPRVPYLQAGFGHDGKFHSRYTNGGGGGLSAIASERASFGWDWAGLNPFTMFHNFWGRHFARMNVAAQVQPVPGAPIPVVDPHAAFAYHRRHFAYVPQAPIGFHGDFGWGGGYGGFRGGFPGGGFPSGGFRPGFPGGGFPGGFPRPGFPGGYPGASFPGGGFDAHLRHREWEQQQALQGNLPLAPPAAPPVDFDPSALATPDVGWGGGYGRGGGYGSGRMRRMMRREQMQQQQQYPQSPMGPMPPPPPINGSFGREWVPEMGFGGGFGGHAPPPPAAARAPVVPSTVAAPPASTFNRVPEAPIGTSPAVELGRAIIPPPGVGIPGRFAPPPPVVPGLFRPEFPGGFPGAGYPGGGFRDDSAYADARRRAFRHDEWLAQQNAGLGGGVPYPYPPAAPPIAYQPGQAPWVDPNQADPTIQDPSLDAQSGNQAGATDDAS